MQRRKHSLKVFATRLMASVSSRNIRAQVPTRRLGWLWPDMVWRSQWMNHNILVFVCKAINYQKRISFKERWPPTHLLQLSWTATPTSCSSLIAESQKKRGTCCRNIRFTAVLQFKLRYWIYKRKSSPVNLQKSFKVQVGTLLWSMRLLMLWGKSRACPLHCS